MLNKTLSKEKKNAREKKQKIIQKSASKLVDGKIS